MSYKSNHIKIRLISLILIVIYTVCTFNYSVGIEFFEKFKLTESGDSTFTCTTDRLCEIASFKKADCLLDSIILTDVIYAAYLWKMQGIPVTTTDNGIMDINLNRKILPINHKGIYPGPYTKLKSLYNQFKMIDVIDHPERAKLTQQEIINLKKGINLIDIDYALRGDSLIIAVFRCIYKMQGDSTSTKKHEQIDFIHKYDCTDNSWKLTNISDSYNYFPEIFARDYLREAITDDIKYYISFLYRYDCWRNSIKSDKNGRTDDENVAELDYLLNEVSTFEEYCKNHYIETLGFPSGAVDSLNFHLNIIPEEYYWKNNYKECITNILSNSKWLMSIELKVSGNLLIIWIHTTALRYNIKSGFPTCLASRFGFFVHRFDCESERWSRTDEYIFSF